jgi:hypothetical protein
MKKLALLFFVLPLAGCATTQQQATENCDPRWPGYDSCVRSYRAAPLSHWQMTTAIYNGFNSVGSASAASTGPTNYPGGANGGR